MAGTAGGWLKRGRAILLGGLLVLACVIAAVFAFAWGEVDAHHEPSTAVFERGGVPVVARAGCGKPASLQSVEVRVFPSEGQSPTDDDEVVFSATATGGGRAEVPLASEIAGYTVEVYRPLRPGTAYYVTQTRYISSSGDGAPSFTVSDLSDDAMHVLFPLPKSDSERTVPTDEWLSSTSC